MKVVVTGATGFVGRHLVEALVERGDHVRVLVRTQENVQHLRSSGSVEIIEGHVGEITSLTQAMQGAERVYHLAARTDSWGRETDFKAINVDGLANVIFTALSTGIQRIIHASSITVYGHQLNGVITEDAPLVAENNPYSRSKVLGEKLIAHLVEDCRAPVVVVRPGWIYGPGDTTSFARLAAFIESGKGRILGTGTNVLPLVHVRDVVQGLIKAGDAGNEAIGRAYTLVHDQQVTQAEYIQKIAQELGVAPVHRHIPYRLVHTAGRCAEQAWRTLRREDTPPPLTTYEISLLGGDYRFSIERARQELGYAPSITINQGVTESVEWLKAINRSGDHVAETHEPLEESLQRQESVEGIRKRACV